MRSLGEDKPRALLVNPWVCDFKAFDFWNKPLGLLIVARLLKEFGFQLTLLDCMDRCSVYYKCVTKTDAFGRGKYTYEIIEKPDIYRNVPRFYKRYGVPRDVFSNTLKQVAEPDLIFVTSTMTYWYPGVFEAIRLLKQKFPKTPVILGGIYASLCTEHAKAKSAADIVLPGPAEQNLPILLGKFGYVQQTKEAVTPSMPDFSLYDALHYGVVLTSRGCPYKCTYCATRVLSPRFQIVPNQHIIHQLHYLARRTHNIAFFDDALLYNNNLSSLLDDMILMKSGLNFHTSNGLHCRMINEGIANKMHRANFKTMYLSLETTNPDLQEHTGGKVTTDEFIEAVRILKRVGFAADSIHAYLLYGMPGQGHEEITESIRLCHELAIHPHLCEFSPIPYTIEYGKTGFDKNTDPLFHNNLFYTWYHPAPKIDLYNKIKRLLFAANHS